MLSPSRDIVTTLSAILPSNPATKQWYSRLSDLEKQKLTPIIDKVLAATIKYNTIFPGHGVWVVGSSLNIQDREYNDIDVMVTIPEEALLNFKKDTLKTTWDLFLDGSISGLTKLGQDPKVKLIGLDGLIAQSIESVEFLVEVNNKDREALEARTGSFNAASNILLDPSLEMKAIKERLQGQLTTERNVTPVDDDGSQGYKFGSYVDAFMMDLGTSLNIQDKTGKHMFFINWYKSFSEGYGRTAGNNNCHIYPNVQCKPVHVFLTTAMDLKKANEKKDSFMLELYTEAERMKPVQLL